MRIATVRVFVACVLLPAALGVRYDLVPTHEAGDLSYADFQRLYVDTKTPVVVKGFMNKIFDGAFKPGKGFEFVRKTCGSVPLESSCYDDDGSLFIQEKHGVRQPAEHLVGKEWGGLEQADIREAGISTVGDLIVEQLRRKRTGEPQLYLHDHSIDSLCPELLQTFQIPKYFAFDYYSFMEFHQHYVCREQGQFPAMSPESGDIRPFHLRDREHYTKHQWPSLFLGPNNTKSSLHTDASATHFWMVVVEGTKWWRLFPLEQIPNLYPNKIREHEHYDMKIYDNFGVDVFNINYTKHPLARQAWGWEQNLTRGDIIYIPQMTPHAVKNVGDTVSYSYNMVDSANLDVHFDADFLYRRAEAYTGQQSWFLKFLKNNLTVPEPTQDAETLGQFYARNHPINLMKLPENKKAWEATGNAMSFEEWFDSDSRGDGFCRDTAHQCHHWAMVGNCGTTWMSKYCAKSCQTCDACMDRSDECPTWADEGECQANPEFMHAMCSFSCHACCNDFDDNCPMWAKRGECDANPAWMAINCPKSCGKCATPCIDHHMSCRDWEEYGKCEEHEQWMTQWCPGTCNKCPEHGCHDRRIECAGWARIGECQANAEWMLTNCCVSCTSKNTTGAAGSHGASPVEAAAANSARYRW